MFVYLIALLIPVGGLIVSDFSERSRYKRLCMVVIWIYLTLLIGLRYKVGGDTLNYMGDYQWRVPLKDWSFNPLDIYQPGYTLLCSVAKSISPEFYVFQLIHVAIVNTLLFIFINRYTKYFFASLLSVFFTCYLYFTTEILREVIAVLIFVLNYKSLMERRWLRYYLGVLASCCFHISAIFLVIIPIFRSVKINRRYFIIFSITLIAMFFLKSILNLLAEISIIGDKIDSYKDVSSIGLLADALSTSRSSLFPLLFVILAKYVCKRQVKFENMIAIMCLLGIAAFFSPIIFNRATNYFILFYSVSIADFCVHYLKKGSKTLRRNSIIISLCFFMLYGSDYIMYGRYTRWVPYHSIFNPITINRDSYGDQ